MKEVLTLISIESYMFCCYSTTSPRKVAKMCNTVIQPEGKDEEVSGSTNHVPVGSTKMKRHDLRQN